MKSSILTIALFFLVGAVMAQVNPDTSKINTTVKEKKETKTQPDSSKVNKITVNEEGSKPMNKKGRHGRSAEGNSGTAEGESSKKNKRKSSDELWINEEN